MSNDRAVVLAVVVALAGLSLLGMVGTFLLLNAGRDAAVFVTLAAAPMGALAGILATTRTNTAAAGEGEAIGYQRAVEDVKALDGTGG